MENETNKPRLVFFQWKHQSLPEFLQLHMQLHVRCLSEFFEVILINEDCDYQQVCDKYQPDLALFESGYKTLISRRITIKNTSAYPDIPKLGLHNGDPWCDCRVGFISDMEHWGIETFFSIGTVTAESTPELADHLFAWPNFIDGNIYRDYKQTKIVPVLFNGYINPLYPWREKIYKIVSNSFPSLIYPHLGYESHSPMMIHGEQYARTINASWFVPACGSLAKEVVRKHFEIPGCKACLLTERSPSLEAAGFVDMQNCVFADEHDVLDKLDHLFTRRHELEQIIQAGYELVHTHHTLKQRNQIFQWFDLNRKIKPNEKIVQDNPFEPLRVVEKSSGINGAPIKAEGLHLVLLHQGDEKLWAGKYEEAQAFYFKCLNYIHWMAEPKLKLAISYLYRGMAAEALHWVSGLNFNNMGKYKTPDPDPVEWAYFIIALLCQGNINEAIIRSSQFPSLMHPELVRTRWVIHYLQQEGQQDPIPTGPYPKSRYSIHQLPSVSFSDWVRNLCVMLQSCKQFRYIGRLNNLISDQAALADNQKLQTRDGLSKWRKQFLRFRIKWLNQLSFVFAGLHIPDSKPGLPPTSEIDYIIRLGRWAGIGSLKKALLKFRNRFKAYYPSTQDEFLQVMQTLVRKEGVKTMLVIGGSNMAAGVEAGLLKHLHGQERVNVFHVNMNDGQYNHSKAAYPGEPGLKYYEFASASPDSFSLEFNEFMKQLREDNKISCFDLILVEDYSFDLPLELADSLDIRFIVLNGINGGSSFGNKQKLISGERYSLISQNPSHQKGYAIFKKARKHQPVAIANRFGF